MMLHTCKNNTLPWEENKEHSTQKTLRVVDLHQTGNGYKKKIHNRQHTVLAFTEEAHERGRIRAQRSQF